MAIEKVGYEFPHELEDKEENVIEVEDSGAVEIDLSGKKTEEDYRAEQEPEPEAEEELEIEVVDDTPKADQGRQASEPPEDVTEEELEGYGNKVKKRISKIQKGYHDERRAKEAAEREREEAVRVAQQLAEENRRIKEDFEKNREALLEQAKKSSNIEVAVAKKQYKDAYEAGDADKVMDAQEKLTNAKLKADKLQNFQLEPLQTEVDTVPSGNTSEPQLDDKTQDWVSRNESWFQKDTEMTSLAMGLHTKLAEEGNVVVGSDEYFERIDSRLREIFPDKFEDAPKKKRANVVAPATRSTAPKKVTLNATQVRLAKRLGLTLEQYAQQLAKESRMQ